MSTRNTRTALTDVNGNNRTATHLSSNIIIKVDNYVVGAVQSISINESRSVKMIDEVGTDGHIDSAPNKSADYKGSCERVRFDGARIAEAFARGFVHVGSQRIPFDIEIHDVFADADVNNAVVTVLKNVWITGISHQLGVNDWVITDRMDFEAETIFSIQNNANVVKGVMNGQNGTVRLNEFEQQADRGLFRGALDQAGVLTAFLTDNFS